MKNKPASKWEPGIGELEDMRRRGTLSARGASKVAAPSGAFSVAGCSLPVSLVDFYIDKWETHLALCVPGCADEKITMIGLFLKDLRAMKVAANVRQPRENVPGQERALPNGEK